MYFCLVCIDFACLNKPSIGTVPTMWYFYLSFYSTIRAYMNSLTTMDPLTTINGMCQRFIQWHFIEHTWTLNNSELTDNNKWHVSVFYWTTLITVKIYRLLANKSTSPEVILERVGNRINIYFVWIEKIVPSIGKCTARYQIVISFLTLVLYWLTLIYIAKSVLHEIFQIWNQCVLYNGFNLSSCCTNKRQMEE